MHDAHLDLIMTLTGGLAAALFLGYLTQLMRLSPIVGYLLAGIAVGPYTPGFEANKGLADQMAEIGVILLMFGVGLHFHFHELLAVRKIAIPGALGQSAFATLLGCLLGYFSGWGITGGIVFGLAISVASTVVLLRVLADNNQLHTPSGHIAVGWLVVEDLLTVLVLVLLPPLVHLEGGSPGSLAWVLSWSLAKIVLLVLSVFVIGGRIIPWFLGLVAQTRSRELFTLSVLVVALGIAVGAAKVFGVSMALGAFLAGMIVGKSEFSSRAASEALPMRDAFAVLFFVSVGMLFDPFYLLQNPLLVAATLAIILIGKPLAALAIVLWLRYPLRSALTVAVVLGQIGEFSFILAALGKELGVLPEVATNAMIASALVSISINPLVFLLVDPAEKLLMRRPAFAGWLNRRKIRVEGGTTAEENSEKRLAVVVGYGPVGRTLTQMLKENGFEINVIELNLTTVHRLKELGIGGVYGDASHRETLVEAGIGRAAALMMTSSSTQNVADTIRVARELNPSIRVLVRATYLKETKELRGAGADVVFSGEGEVALTMTEFLLRHLGATEDQIDRENQRIREELFGTDVLEFGPMSAQGEA